MSQRKFSRCCLLLLTLVSLILVQQSFPTLDARETAEPVWAQEPAGCDSGLYLLLTTGQIERVGNPPFINGGFAFDDDLARDMERAVSNSGSEEKPDLVVLDGSGVTHFVENAGDDIPQSILFPPTPDFPIGRAVDLEMSQSSEGLWVLTDFGGIYRAGDTKDPTEKAVVPGTNQMGILGYDIPIGTMRNPNMANPGGASLRAVALVVIDVKEPLYRADGYIVVDSMGAHYCFNADGTRVMPGSAENAPANDPAKLLDPDSNRGGYVWPFFPGLDIARDADLYPDSQEGLVVFDGWGGIHPVPVDLRDNAVYFTRNEDPNAAPGTLITTVGMPYIVIGFDDPETGQDESDPSIYGADVYSIFQDYEFSAGCPEGGFYTLDKFGAVYAFGSARIAPDWIFPAWRMPYIASQNAQAIELFAAYEAGPTPTPSLTPSARPTPVPTSTATLTPTFTETPTETMPATTSTPSSSPTGTATPTPSESVTPTHSLTVTPTETVTMTSTYTATVTLTPTETWTETSTDTVTGTLSETETWIPTFTFTVTETGTSTVTKTPSPTLTSTWTETPFAPTRTLTKTATSTFLSTMTETETETSTGTRPPTEPPPTATRTPVFACVQAAKIELVCAGETSVAAAPFRIKLMPKVDTSVCGAATNTAQPLAIVYVDPASVADENPFDETKFNKGFHCDVALEILGKDISAQLNSQGFVAEMSLPGSVYVESAVPFSCSLCTDEAGLPCESPNIWPLDVCGLGNLGDGVNGNETSFTDDDFSELTSGLGLICLKEECPTPTPTYTRLPTWSPNPNNQTITIDLPGLPEGASPLRLVRIPAGSFLMGSPETERGHLDEEGPVHHVKIGYDFYMGETEITQAQWKAVMGASPYSGYGVGNDYPAHASWDEITETDGFLERLSALNQGIFRLPSESEWEYACRAGTTTRHYFGDSLDCNDICDDCAAGTLPGKRSDYMWYCGNNNSSSLKPVHGKLPNSFGLYDMHGSVAEWCQDYWHASYYSGVPTNGVPWLDGFGSQGMRVFRVWSSSADSCRSAARSGTNPDNFGISGLRVVLEIPATPTPTYNPDDPTWTPTTTFTNTITPTATPTPISNIDTITIEIPGLPEEAHPLRMVRIPAGSFLNHSRSSPG